MSSKFYLFFHLTLSFKSNHNTRIFLHMPSLRQKNECDFFGQLGYGKAPQAKIADMIQTTTSSEESERKKGKA